MPAGAHCGCTHHDTLSERSTVSFAKTYRQLLEDSRVDDERPATGSRAAADAPALRARALAWLQQTALDRRLADGESCVSDGDLTARAWQITRPAARRRLASALDAVLAEAGQPRPRRQRGAVVPICRQEVEVARDEIQRLAERLRDPRPVRPRGVALARQLLADGNGPLYVPSTNDELWRQMRRTAVALD
jgi:hypothetical protein